MELYYAPMEGITGYLHRNVSRAVFPDIDKYMTPFIAANQKGKLSTKDSDSIPYIHIPVVSVLPPESSLPDSSKSVGSHTFLYYDPAKCHSFLWY